MNENDFKKRFGSNSPLPPYNWSDDDYASGWNITGDMPPTRQQFDALQRTNDDKAAYLLDKVYSSARLLRRSTHYNKGDRVYAEGLKAGLYLECTTAGMSGTDAIDFSSSKVGDTITDGGVTWTICKEIGTSNAPLIAGYNGKQTFTSSGTFTAPITGLYKITLQGGGGGGSGAGTYNSNVKVAGGGGGQGGHGEFYEKLTAGQTYSFTIGAGGTGGAAGSDTAGTGAIGSDGGDTTIIIADNTYTSTGGKGAGAAGIGLSRGGLGGEFRINDNIISRAAPGGTGCANNYAAYGATGGGAGGGNDVGYANAVNGGGGSGGTLRKDSPRYTQGWNGGDGYITFEWQTGALA